MRRIFWMAWCAIALSLLGCESVSNFSSQLPQWDAPVNKSQTPSTPAQSPTAAKMEAEVRERINQVRQQKGLNSLKNNEKLAEVARKYSREMARKNFFSHVSPEGSTLSQRVRAGGIYYWVVGENLFMSSNAPQPVPLAIKGWMNSPGHRENLLGSGYTETGVGVWREGNKVYITQLFLRSQFSLKDLIK